MALMIAQAKKLDTLQAIKLVMITLTLKRCMTKHPHFYYGTCTIMLTISNS